MNLRRPLLCAALLLLNFYALFAQSAVKGKITDTKTGSPVPGASVKIKGTRKGTTTNNEGLFSLPASVNDVLEISFVGYKTQSVTVTGSADMSVALEPGAADLNEVVIVGSRGAPRVRTESPVPIDIIKVNQLGEVTAKPDLMSQLNMAVPSFNYNKQSGGDGSDAIDFASLRGLGFDQTLVLINGKRRHLSAFVNQVGTRGRGNSGTDLNAIPEAAIDRIEILRDGASAQYGSDAIAGVINIILKKDIKKLNISTGWSGYADHKYNTLNNVDPSQYYTGSQIDGKTFTLAMDYGLPIGKNGGFINIGGNYMNQGKTFRAVPDTNVHSNTNPADALPVDDWRRAAGDGSVVSGGAMYNLEIPLKGTKTSFYSFGGYNYKHSNVYAWTRRWHSTSNRLKFPTDANGNLIFVPGIMQVFEIPFATGELEQVTFGRPKKQSAFIWWAPEYQDYVFTVMQISNLAFYRRIAGVWRKFNQFVIPNGKPYVSSPEAFVINDTSYIAVVSCDVVDFQVWQPRGPSEVWVTGIDPAHPFFRRIDDPSYAAVRMEPEPYVLDGEAVVYYTEMGGRIHLVKRAKTGITRIGGLEDMAGLTASEWSAGRVQ